VSLEEDYLDNLLKSVTNPESADTKDEIVEEDIEKEETAMDDINLDAEEPALDEIALDEEPVLDEEPTLNEEPALDDLSLDELISDEAPLEAPPESEGESLIDEISEDTVEEDETPLDEESLQELSLDELDVDDNKEEAAPKDDSLEDILSMLDDDSELAEINDMLQKNDGKEPVQDDMMDLLNQMADDEAESINAGVVVVDDEDDGVPIPAFKTAKSSDDESEEDLNAEEEVEEEEDEAEIEDESEEMDEPETEENEELESDEEEEPSEEIETDFEVMSEPILESEDDGMEDVPVYAEEVEKPEKKAKKEKDKKEKVKKDKPKKEKADGEPKEGGKLSKLFDLLTQDLVPEPTEEELEAEKEAKAAKKQENLSKKDEAKQAKAAEKAAKAEEKEAAKKAKAEETAKKKKEKAEANRVKKEAKAAKKAEIAAANKGKKIPKKNIIAAAIFGITVLAAVLLATSVLSRQGYLRAARRAFYNEDYLAVYQDTYGMDLDAQDSDGLIAAKSEVIMKIQRRYDSYQNNLKMGRDLEALDALIQGLATYDYINADAEQYGVIAEVDKIKDNILDILQAKYGLSEEQARSIMNEEDASAYTIDLDNVLLSLNK
jgi:hypothetical protein